MKPSNRKAYIKRVYQAATKLIFNNHWAGNITEDEYNRLLRALEAIQTDKLDQEELLRMLPIDDQKNKTI